MCAPAPSPGRRVRIPWATEPRQPRVRPRAIAPPPRGRPTAHRSCPPSRSVSSMSGASIGSSTMRTSSTARAGKPIVLAFGPPIFDDDILSRRPRNVRRFIRRPAPSSLSFLIHHAAHPTDAWRTHRWRPRPHRHGSFGREPSPVVPVLEAKRCRSRATVRATEGSEGRRQVKRLAGQARARRLRARRRHLRRL